MSDQQQKPPSHDNGINVFAKQVSKKVARRLKAQRSPSSRVWFGLGMMGLVGWSVTVPTVLGAALGLWLDGKQQGQHSWTLALLVAGLCIGCFNAWHWINQEDQAIHEKNDNNDE